MNQVKKSSEVCIKDLTDGVLSWVIQNTEQTLKYSGLNILDTEFWYTFTLYKIFFYKSKLKRGYIW